ncbi:MAG TPA: hypothetical protein VGG22_15115 [Candidatus Baltobacteraceae bacterium]|jgi:amino acid transporter
MSDSDASALFALLFYAAFLVLFTVGWFRIFRKAGYNGWLSLLMIIPIVAIGVLIWFAVATWPKQMPSRAGR